MPLSIRLNQPLAAVDHQQARRVGRLRGAPGGNRNQAGAQEFEQIHPINSMISRSRSSISAWVNLRFLRRGLAQGNCR